MIRVDQASQLYTSVSIFTFPLRSLPPTSEYESVLQPRLLDRRR